MGNLKEAKLETKKAKNHFKAVFQIPFYRHEKI